MNTESLITEQQIYDAVAQLKRSDIGLRALRDLSAFLENGAISFDSKNIRATILLLTAVWGDWSGTVLEAISPESPLSPDEDYDASADHAGDIGGDE